MTQPKNAIVIGAGWAGSILAKELTDAGLNVVMFERGPERRTALEGAYPASIDELNGTVRRNLFADLAKSTVTVRTDPSERALPYRRLGAFLPGEGVGGAGLHWAGCHFRVIPEELEMRTYVERKFGKSVIPKDMHLQDFGVTYDELEPFFDFAEKVFGTSGEAYTVKGKVAGDGNPFAPDRSQDFPLPPLGEVFTASLFKRASKACGYHPYAIPGANASRAYVNPYGCQMGACNFCGYCAGYDCFVYAKATPNVNVLPALKNQPLFELRHNAPVVKILYDAKEKKATGVEWIDLNTGEKRVETADIVILSAFQLQNVHLLMVSGIGEIYDPKTGKGTVGRNFNYQTITSSRVWLDSDQNTNQFVGAGGAGVAIDDFTLPRLDLKKLGFVGGSSIWVNQSGVKPIAAAVGFKGGEKKRGWGAGFKAELKETYRHSFAIDAHGSNMAYRNNYLDLDPTWKNEFGQPLMRMTFNWNENDIRMNEYVVEKIGEIAKKLNPKRVKLETLAGPFDVRQYKTTHLGGGACMGDDPETSVVNRYLQNREAHNLFVIGSSAFPHGITYNPTGLVAALSYWAAYHIKTRYLASPGFL